jgi:Flp pilus assembly protein CpaB
VDPRSIAALAPTRTQIVALAQYILQNVEVLAMAQQMEGDTPPPSTSDKIGKAVVPNGDSQPAKQQTTIQPGAHTATLAVAPDEAQKLVLAEEKGRIRLVLRAHGDQTTFKIDDEVLFTNVHGAAALKSEPKP